MPARGPPRPRDSPRLRGSAAPGARLGRQRRGLCRLSPPEPPPRSAAAEPSERVSSRPQPLYFYGRAEEHGRARCPSPRGAGVLRASSQTSHGAKPTCGPRGSPQFPRPVHPAAPAAARTKPGASLLHGGLLLVRAGGRSGPRAAAAPGAAGAAGVPRGAAAATPQGSGSFLQLRSPRERSLRARSRALAAHPPRRRRAASAPRGKVLPPPPRVAFY